MSGQNIEYNDQALPLKDRLESEMEKVHDPEIGLDVVNLGLIYKVEFDSKSNCDITLTFTSMGCSCITEVQDNLKSVIGDMDEVNSVNLNVVWEPAWDLTRISRFGRISLGINPGR